MTPTLHLKRIPIRAMADENGVLYPHPGGFITGYRTMQWWYDETQAIACNAWAMADADGPHHGFGEWRELSE